MLWDKTLETGISSVDEQHQELFRRIDLLMDISNENRTKEILGYLEQYIAIHFKDEQELQTKSKYPKAIMHKAYHDDYIRSFRKLKEQYLKEGENLTTRMAINKSVLSWLREHILVHDREFAKYYQSVNK